jgi:signal transduction histidine kinase
MAKQDAVTKARKQPGAKRPADERKCAPRQNLEELVQARTAELEAAKAILEEEIADRRLLERQILEISEREQRRIGQDLHDGLGQQITGIIFHAHLLHKHLAAKGLKEADAAAQIVALLDEAKVQARQIARGLQPLDAAPLGLMNGLAHFAGVTSDLYRIDCRFHCPEPVQIGDHIRATHLFRIAQEAVANAFRHGKASVIEIRLVQSDGTLSLEVIDNGCGLAKGARRRNGLGLRFMHYRAQTIGGALEILSHRDGQKGTLIRCTVRDGA